MTPVGPKPFGVVKLMNKHGEFVGWRAVWIEPPNMQRSKPFPFKKHGEDAYALAIQYRAEQVDRLVRNRRASK